MAQRNQDAQSEHDEVVAASGHTYASWRAKGYEIVTNPNGKKNQGVGSKNGPQYPDVVVWKRETPGASTGTAVVIEEIETADSVTDTEAAQWAKYARLGVETFILVVPANSKQTATQIVQRKGIDGITKIQSYRFEQGQIVFE